MNYTDEELKAFADETHRLGRKIAGHAIGWDGDRCGTARRVQHHRARRWAHPGSDRPDGAAEGLLVPHNLRRGPTWPRGGVASGRRWWIWNGVAFGTAVHRGMLPYISYGTDAGGYAWTENQAQELAFMVRYGMTPMQAIKSATSVAARLLGAAAESGRNRGRTVCRSDRGHREPARGYHRAPAGEVRDEGGVSSSRVTGRGHQVPRFAETVPGPALEIVQLAAVKDGPTP